ncbi:MAG: peptidylprolyl isomerase [Anaerolineales bacterium]|nr:peptidylprolyl isomerase [Anaerolineales bacterium]
MAQLKVDFPEDVRIVYRHFPLASIHDKALLAAQASEAAGLQGKFWEMHYLLYERFSDWASLSVVDFQGWLIDNAVPLELDADQFESDLTSEEIVALAQSTWEEGQQLGLPGTPFFVLNNNPYNGPLDSANIAAILSLNEFAEQQYTECPPVVIDPLKGYTATIQTEKGDIVIELFPDVAPLTVNSFVFLAQEGWFDDISFHRVLPGFMAQGGDPTGTGLGGPGYAFKNESSEDLSFDREGLVAMANSGPDTNGSQFFITYGPATHLDGGYTIFAEVIDGMEVVQNLTPRDPSQSGELPPGDSIITVTITEQ